MNLALLLDLATDACGDRVALASDQGSLTFEDLRRQVVHAATVIAAAGPGPVVLIGDTGPSLPVALFGAAWAGRSFIPLNHRLPSDVVAAQVASLGGAVVVVGPGALVPRPPGPASLDVDQLLAPPSDTPTAPAEPAAVDPSRPAVELFTSGTSGPPKRAVLAHEHLFSYVATTVDLAGADPGEALLLATPPFHIAAITAVLSSSFAGRTVVPLGRFTAEAWVDAADRHGATHAFVVPTMLGRVLDLLDERPDLPAPSLRHLSYGGARMPRPTIERALDRFPQTSFVNAYGLTETSSTITILGPEDHRRAREGDPLASERLASVGRAVPGIELRVVGEDGGDLARGARGRVLVRGPQVSGRYADRPPTLDVAGWLTTGDVGHLDGDGYLYLDGRADDVIIKGAENLSPGEIEDALLAHHAVAAAAVVGIPDASWGEQVAAAVVAVPGASVDEAELQAWVRDRLGSFKVPGLVDVVVDLPETPTGKVLRREVRSRLVAATATGAAIP